MTGLILATGIEAEPLVERLGARKPADGPCQTYQFPGGVIVVSGMGKRAAAAAAERLIVEHRVEAVVNVGICGALIDRLAPGTLVRVAEAIDGDSDPAEAIPCDGGAWAHLPPVRLVSVDEAVFEDDRRAALGARGDVVDMEGAAIARVCREHQIPLHALKGVTDLAGPGGKLDIKKNIADVATELAEIVAAGLPRKSRKRGQATFLPRKVACPLFRSLQFVKIEHSVFSLPLLFAGAWLGAGRRWPSLAVLALIAVAGVGARTLGMAMNRILDRRLDALNPRTAARELPGGRMSLAPAWGVAAAGLAVYLAACAALGPVCLALSPAPAAGLIVYSLLKRFTSLCHFGIGLCMALAPLGAFVAASGGIRFGPEALLLAAFAFCWISGFDIVYAILDIDSDGRTGVRSIPAALGARGAEIVSAVVHVPALAALVWLWWSLGAGAMAGVALAVAAGGLAMGHWTRIPVGKRFFPVSAIAGVAGALVPLLGGLR